MKTMTMNLIVASAIAVAIVPLAAKAADDGSGRLKAVENPVVVSECSACHMVYPAGLLPQRSWKALLANLSNHFGEDASLDEPIRKQIEDYLVANASDASGQDLMRLDPAVTPLRISELPWFTWRHGKRTHFRAKADSKIGSISNCAGCHQDAAQGIFGDD
jgi:hypothetical protein